jgi:hypothetical protein
VAELTARRELADNDLAVVFIGHPGVSEILAVG